ncbi:hypothetical protein H072_8113 [Dactylellina haptotyla CBS 200.50]|uniref:Uncharacterized protein n=1 Tax=Dactylellina haptotyla (strain CBS 200.50) TaxID=1284197 RepID=S8AAX2_DACHA|nr:hypothetical protein H072_8113 [Dactylellina haptotyla CBS 200.50]
MQFWFNNHLKIFSGSHVRRTFDESPKQCTPLDSNTWLSYKEAKDRPCTNCQLVDIPKICNLVLGILCGVISKLSWNREKRPPSIRELLTTETSFGGAAFAAKPVSELSLEAPISSDSCAVAAAAVTAVSLFGCRGDIKSELSWALEQYLSQQSNVPWTDKIMMAVNSQHYSYGSADIQAAAARIKASSKLDSQAVYYPSQRNIYAPQKKGSNFSRELPTPPEMDYNMEVTMVGVTEHPSSEGRGHHRRSSSHSFSKGSMSSKYSGTSKSGGRRSDYGQEEDEEDNSQNYPNYIPSSHSRSKNKTSSSSDFACWFFKLDPVKYADCMHVHGRSSDLKYAHLKHHFRNGGVPSEFDKNMSWDEVWNTLFPQIAPPNNKYYVINEMIMSILESAAVDGDDVTRFLDAFETPSSRETVTNRIYGLYRDRGTSPGSSTSPNRRNRGSMHLPSFDQIPRSAGKSLIITPPSSSGGSSNSTPALSSRPSQRYPSSHLSYTHDPGYTLQNSDGVDHYHGFSHYHSQLSPSSIHPSDVRKVLIFDEQCNTLWFERELPSPAHFDFGTHYLFHECNKSGREEGIHMESFEELQAEFEWHKAGQIGGNCHFTIFAFKRGQ